MNGELIEGNQLRIRIDNRAFHYGDGFFESLRFENGDCKLWKYHVERIYETGKALRMCLEKDFGSLLLKEIHRLLEKIGLTTGHARVRLQVYRSGGGKYSPHQNQPSFLIEAEPLDENPMKGITVSFCAEPIVGRPSFKGAKTVNALPYVLAGIERGERRVDEILLYGTDGNLIEASASNLWWVEDESIYTPPLTSGCVNGVFRRHLLKGVPEQGIEVMEKTIDKVELMKAKEVFLTNAVQGIQWVDEIDGIFFESQVSHYLIESLGF